MRYDVISLRKRLLALLLMFAMVVGMFTSLPQTKVQAADTTATVLLEGQPALEATRIMYQNQFDKDETLANFYVPSTSTAKVEDGALYFESASEAPLYILDGEMWGYYTMEADITYHTSTAGAEVCFYVQNAEKYVVATLPKGESGDAYHVQIVANGTTANMSYATYGLFHAMGDMSEPVPVEVVVSAQSGSVGFGIIPIDGEDKAAMSIDNLIVSKNIDEEAAKHTLLSADFDEYTSSKKLGATNTYDDYYIKTDTTGIALETKEQKLYITGSGSDDGVMYFDVPDAVHWDNYVVEADVCQTNSMGWGSLLYRVQSLESFQSAGLHADGTADLKGYWHDWVNSDEDNGIYHQKDTGATIGTNEIRRLKIVVHGDMADLYVASYTDNDPTKALGDWDYLLSINDIADHHATGSVGFLVAEGAEFWLDNLDVYEYTTTYLEDFDDYSDRTLYDGATYTVEDEALPDDATEDERKNHSTFITEDTTTGLTMQLYKTDSANSTVKIENHALTIKRTTDDNTKATLAWLEAGTNWTNYTYEVDILPEKVSTSAWHGLAYRVQGRHLWQRAALTKQAKVLNRVGYGVIGVNTVNGVDSYLDKFTAPYDYEESLSSGVGFATGAKIRMKVVVKNYRTWIYTARYNNGILEPYNLHVVLDYCKSLSGAAGMVVSHTNAVSYDNIVVSATTQETGTTNLADIVEPQTGIVNPPTVVTKVDGTNYENLTGTAVAILDIDSNLDILGTDGKAIGSVSQFMHKYGDTVIPAFELNSSSDVTAICDYLKKHVITDALYVSNDAALLLSARETWGFARGILEYDKMPTDHAATRREINGNLAMVTILPNEELTQELVSEYNVRGVSVWSYVEDVADVYKGIANGYNGLIANNPRAILDVYESITVPTLSGKPIIVGHQGMFVEGEYYGNNIHSYTTAVNTYGAMGIEIDAKKTKDNQFVMMHDLTINRTTTGTGTISQMTLAEIKAFTTKCGNEIPTLEEAMEALSKTRAVVYIDHGEANAAYVAEYNRLIEKYNMQDQVVVLCGRTQVNDVGNYIWTNSSWGDRIPVISGSIWLERDYDLTTATAEEILSTSIHTLSRYNHQQIPFEREVLGQDDETAYNVEARGFLYLQCTTPEHTVSRTESDDKQSAAKLAIDRAYISEKGATAVIIDDPERTQDYSHMIVAENDIVKIGETLNLEKTIKKVVGTDTAVTCKVTWLTGNVVEKDGSYTMNEPGVATAVYYKDIELDRGYDSLTYRIYSEPVTIEWNEDGKPHEHVFDYDGSKYYSDEDGHWQICATCEVKSSKVAHTETTKGVKPATEMEHGYTGDTVCPTCDYVLAWGNDIECERFKGFTYLTPEDFGYEYDMPFAEKGWKSASKVPVSSMNKTVFTTRFNYLSANITYMIPTVGDGLQLNAKNYSTTNNAVIIDINNYYSGTDKSIYTFSAEGGYTQNTGYHRIRAYEAADTTGEIELAISIEFCNIDEGTTNNDIKVGIYINGQLFGDTFLYLKDSADVCYPSMRINPAVGMQFEEPTIIRKPHVHSSANADKWQSNVQKHWQTCECGKVMNRATHEETIVGQIEASPTSKGYTGDKVCRVCGYVLEKGEDIIYRAFADYKIITPEDFGYEYDTQYSGWTNSTKKPQESLDKTIFITKFSQWNGNITYMFPSTKDGLLLQKQGSGSNGYLTLSNFMTGSDGKVYTLNADGVTYAEYSAGKVSVYVYENGDMTQEIELGISVEFCDIDSNGSGAKDDIKIGFWINGVLNRNRYFYLKDCAPNCYPGMRVSPQTGMTFQEPSISTATTIQPTITDSIAMNYTATINPLLLQVSEPIMTFEKAGKTYGQVKGTPVADDSNIYTFTYPDIMAQDMDKNITATLQVGGLKKVYEPHSVLSYCESVLAADVLYDAEGTAYSTAKQTAAKDLVVDLVQYGAAVQRYRGVAAEDLHTTKIDKWESYVTQYDNADQEDTNLEGLTDGVVSDKLILENGVQDSNVYTWKSATLVLDNKVNLRCKFTAADDSNLTVKLQIGNSEEMSIEYQKTEKSGEYVFDLDDIYAYEYGEQITVRFYEGNQQVGKTLNYSVNTYLYAKKNVIDLQVLLLAIHNYGKAAVVYRQTV